MRPTDSLSLRHTRSCLAAALGCFVAATIVGCSREPELPEVLLLITADTLRADRLGAFGSELGLTPNLDTLAGESVVFTSVYAAAPFTLPSVSALMTGRYPEELGVFRNESRVPDSVPTLATELRARGWKTRAVVSNFILRTSSGIGSGFETFDDEFPQFEIVRKWPERIASDTTDAAILMLDDCAPTPVSPCFLWVHYQDPHGPYTPPASWFTAELERESESANAARELPVSPDHTGIGAIPNYQVQGDRRDVGFYRAGYHAEIRYLDAEIGRLLAALENRGLADRTLVTFTSDHGEGLGEDDYWFAHGEYLNDGQVHVPLLIKVPGRPPMQRSDTASLTDLFPTLLTALGGAPGDRRGGGRDLLAPGAQRHASRPYFASLGGSRLPRYGIIDGDYKLVITERNGIGDGRLTKRGGNVDLAAAAPQIVKPMRQRLLHIRKRMAMGRDEVQQSLSDEDRRSLEALGYIGEVDDR